MRLLKRRYLKYLAVLALALAAVECGGGSDVPDDGRVRVVTTIYPLNYMAGRVGGTDAEVDLLLGPGAEAHAFEPTTSDVQRLAGAQLVVANGLDLEPWLGRAIEGLSGDDRPVVLEAAAIEGFEPLEGAEAEDRNAEEAGHEIDPHVWLDPVLAQAMVERIRDALIEANPGATQGYTSRAQALIDDLAAIHADYQAGLAACAHTHFVTTHAAYGYLAKRYGLEQIAITGVSAEAEPTPRDLADLTSRVRELGLGHVLVEPSLGSRLAETVAAESGLDLLPIHQMESVTVDELSQHGDYLGLMRDNLGSLKTALGCGG